LLKLCRKFRPTAPAQEKLVLVLDALSKIEIRILALDEVNFTEVGTAAKQKRFLNALRYLANELRISIVCLGTEEMMRVIRSVSSVENRFPPTVLPRWQTDNEFRKLLASFEKIIPLKHPSDLQSSLLTAKLLTRAEGTIGELENPPRGCGNRGSAQRHRAYHGRDHRRMQLYATISAKTALHFWLTYALASLRVPRAFQHFRYLPPDSRFQYRNANSSR
jgi:hypothetical protein